MEAPSIRLSQQWRVTNLNHQSSNRSNSSLDTVQRTPRIRQLTPTSIHSLGSVSSSPLRIRSENTPPARILSRNFFHSADDASLFPSPVRSPKHGSHNSRQGNEAKIPPPCQTASTLIREVGPLEDTDLNSRRGTPGYDSDSDKENQEPTAKEPRLSFESAREEFLSVDGVVITTAESRPEVSATSSATPRTSRSFKRWISHLRPHPLRHKKTLITSAKRWPIDGSPEDHKSKNPESPTNTRSGHRKTSSRSSAGLVDALKSGAMTRSASTPVSRKSRRSNPFSRSNRSSRLSERTFDHSQVSDNSFDSAALARTIQRQKTLDELVESEASYVTDLKVLIHVRELKACCYVIAC